MGCRELGLVPRLSFKDFTTSPYFWTSISYGLHNHKFPTRSSLPRPSQHRSTAPRPAPNRYWRASFDLPTCWRPYRQRAFKFAMFWMWGTYGFVVFFFVKNVWFCHVLSQKIGNATSKCHESLTIINHYYITIVNWLLTMEMEGQSVVSKPLATQVASWNSTLLQSAYDGVLDGACSSRAPCWFWQVGWKN